MTDRISIDLIDIGEQQLRDAGNEDALIELAADIAARGLLQPIGVRPEANGRYQLLWGSRRLKAHQYLRYPTIPAVIRHEKDEHIIDVALAENLHRRQLTLEEECRAVCHMSQSGLSADQIAVRVSKGRGWVLRRLMVSNLPPDLLTPTIDGSISTAVAEALAGLDDTAGRAVILQQALNLKLPHAQVCALIEAWTIGAALPQSTGEPPDQTLTAYTPPKLLQRCALCGGFQPDANIALIRVCAGGCPKSDTAQPKEHSTHVSQ